MYARRIQITNYGPIEQLDISFPFDEQGRPKPVVLVGENGSGKSILLSHIVNGLVAAKGVAYDESPEVPLGWVYKSRSSDYINSDHEYYFAKVDYGNDLQTTELLARRSKSSYPAVPAGMDIPDAIAVWEAMKPQENEAADAFGHYPPLAPSPHTATIKDEFANNCVVYFPADRFDDPAWLTNANLPAEPKYNHGRRIAGMTTRKVIASSMLRDVQDWILDVALSIALIGSPQSDQGQQALKAIQEIITEVVGWRVTQLALGDRGRRVIGISSTDGRQIRNIFQLSSGETGLLSLFLSILRDYDLCERAQLNIPEVRGIVVVDEIDLHMHVKHQRDVLPRLMRMFPQVQFIVTTHSPLFVLGMSSVFGDDGFDLWRLPDGEQIDPEEFSEFEDAYRSFAATRKYADETHAARELIDSATKPLVFVEGKSDIAYLSRAASLLGRTDVLDCVRLEDGNGVGSLTNVWKHFSGSPLADAVSQKVILLFDSDAKKGRSQRGKLFKRTIPKHPENPIEKGIENLFSKATLARAKEHNAALVDVADERSVEVRGKKRIEPAIWSVSDEEKIALCEWLCENGTAEDFKDFASVFNILEEVLQSANEEEGTPD